MLTDEFVLTLPFTVFASPDLSTRVETLMAQTVVVQEFQSLACGHVNELLAGVVLYKFSVIRAIGLDMIIDHK